MTLEFMLVSRFHWSLELRTMIVTTFMCDFIIRSIDSRQTQNWCTSTIGTLGFEVWI